MAEAGPYSQIGRLRPLVAAVAVLPSMAAGFLGAEPYSPQACRVDSQSCFESKMPRAEEPQAAK